MSQRSSSRWILTTSDASSTPAGDSALAQMAAFGRGVLDRKGLVAAAEANATAQVGPVAKLAEQMAEMLARPQTPIQVKAPDVYLDLAAPAAPSVTVKPPDVHVHVEQPKPRPRRVRRRREQGLRQRGNRGRPGVNQRAGLEGTFLDTGQTVGGCDRCAVPQTTRTPSFHSPKAVWY